MKKWLAVFFVLVLVMVLVLVAAASAQEGSAEPTEDTESEVVNLGGVEIVDEPGVLITGVHKDGPAHQAGLHRGDVILRVDGDEVNTAAELNTVIRRLEPGQTVTLSVLRAVEPEDLQVTLGEFGDRGQGYLGVNLYSPLMSHGCALHGLPGDLESFELDLAPELLLEGGALIVSVEEDTPASAAGLQEGDLIVSVDGELVSLEQSLSDLIQSKSVGDQVSLLVERDGEELNLTAALTEHPETEGLAYLGVRIAPSVPAIHSWSEWDDAEHAFPGMEFDAEDTVSGAIVQEVVSGGPAETAGVLEGDLITAVDGELVDHPRALVELIQAHEPGDMVELTILRDDEELMLNVTLDSQSQDGESVAYLGVTAGAFVRWQGHMGDMLEGIEEGEFDFDFHHLFPGLEDNDMLPFHFRMPHFEFDGQDGGTFEFEIPEVEFNSQA